MLFWNVSLYHALSKYVFAYLLTVLYLLDIALLLADISIILLILHCCWLLLETLHCIMSYVTMFLINYMSYNAFNDLVYLGIILVIKLTLNFWFFDIWFTFAPGETLTWLRLLYSLPRETLVQFTLSPPAILYWYRVSGGDSIRGDFNMRHRYGHRPYQ